MTTNRLSGFNSSNVPMDHTLVIEKAKGFLGHQAVVWPATAVLEWRAEAIKSAISHKLSAISDGVCGSGLSGGGCAVMTAVCQALYSGSLARLAVQCGAGELDDGGLPGGMLLTLHQGC
ncbi:hypothetical protein [Marinobacterium aestuarii]|uniref:hypothetical protein n=1 Tax=Marinobacterium aestuarii TaxID=1821621 RepID=UPI0012FF9472|nr:hypothetical protein [Marinobacterium aestuarii]